MTGVCRPLNIEGVSAGSQSYVFVLVDSIWGYLLLMHADPNQPETFFKSHVINVGWPLRMDIAWGNIVYQQRPSMPRTCTWHCDDAS